MKNKNSEFISIRSSDELASLHTEILQVLQKHGTTYPEALGSLEMVKAQLILEAYSGDHSDSS